MGEMRTGEVRHSQLDAVEFSPTAGREPAGCVQLAVRRHVPMNAPHYAEGVESPVAPLVGAAELVRQRLVQREASPRQRRERRAVAPVESQKPTRLARGRARDPAALDHDGFGSAPCQEVRDRRPDDAAAANQDAHEA